MVDDHTYYPSNPFLGREFICVICNRGVENQSWCSFAITLEMVEKIKNRTRAFINNNLIELPSSFQENLNKQIEEPINFSMHLNYPNLTYVMEWGGKILKNSQGQIIGVSYTHFKKEHSTFFDYPYPSRKNEYGVKPEYSGYCLCSEHKTLMYKLSSDPNHVCSVCKIPLYESNIENCSECGKQICSLCWDKEYAICNPCRKRVEFKKPNMQQSQQVILQAPTGPPQSVPAPIQGNTEFCRLCGNKIPAGSVFCMHCGGNLR